MKENNMHRAIKNRIMAFYELQWQYNSVQSCINIFRNAKVKILKDTIVSVYFQGVELTDENWLEKTVVPSELRKKVLHQARFKALTSIRLI